LLNKQTSHISIPVYIIGAGGIVNTAHLPAYAMAGYQVQGIYDIDQQKASDTAQKFAIPQVYESLQELIKELPAHAVIDIAVPGAAIKNILEQLPEGLFVLLQKPMGENLAAAKEILAIAREKKMTAAVNFQLRYAPFIVQARKMINDGLLGAVNDIEINVNVFTPWHLWDFLFSAQRVEILYHSIHYIDLIRSFFGNPSSIYAKTTQHPGAKELASVKSNIIMDYGSLQRANILTNHNHVFGTNQEQSYIKIEGTNGAIKIDFGALRNYPEGAGDIFQYTLVQGDKYTGWQTMPIEGTWFPHAFIGSMEQVLLAAAGLIDKPDNSVEDAIHTMACVEAAYISSERGGINPGLL
jgi:predicted dehydrogenase